MSISKKENPINIVIVDDHDIYRAGVKRVY